MPIYEAPISKRTHDQDSGGGPGTDHKHQRIGQHLTYAVLVTYKFDAKCLNTGHEIVPASSEIIRATLVREPRRTSHTGSNEADSVLADQLGLAEGLGRCAVRALAVAPYPD